MGSSSSLAASILGASTPASPSHADATSQSSGLAITRSACSGTTSGSPEHRHLRDQLPKWRPLPEQGGSVVERAAQRLHGVRGNEARHLDRQLHPVEEVASSAAELPSVPVLQPYEHLESSLGNDRSRHVEELGIPRRVEQRVREVPCVFVGVGKEEDTTERSGQAAAAAASATPGITSVASPNSWTRRPAAAACSWAASTTAPGPNADTTR